MRSSARFLPALLALAYLPACQNCSPTPPPPGGDLTLTSDKPSIPADQVAYATITIAGIKKYPVVVTATKGEVADDAAPGVFAKKVTFQSSGNVVRFRSACDAHADLACAGQGKVSAADDADNSGATAITLLPFEICNNGKDDDGNGKVDCADPACVVDTPCSVTPPDGGVTGAFSCGATGKCDKCSPPGGAPSEGRESTCTDGVDNDCDGLIDCADPDCNTKKCVTVNGGIGTCNAGVCACGTEPQENTCDDGLDNDCDGKTDCEDSDCNAKACKLANGSSGTCLAGKCQCASGSEICSNGKDDDCNGLVDCVDPVCAGKFCDLAKGLTCDAVSKTCSVCPGGQATETSCGDQVDNDCDGLVDCDDPDCAGKGCGNNGLACDSGKKCSCPGGATTETNCGDGKDDDCDGLIDCADPDCKSTQVGTYGKDCSNNTTTFGRKCDWLGVCVCPGGATAETNCGDGKDDDCDGRVDCVDPDCQPGGLSAANPCDATGHTCAATPNGAGNYCTVCAGGQTNETTCGDGKDNDCDGKTDCDDADCNGRNCGPSPTQTCSGGKCVDSATAYTVTLTPACGSPARIPADGVATCVVAVALTNSQGGVVAAQTIALAITGPGTWRSNGLGTISVQTDSTGHASTTFLSDAAGGIASIKGTHSASPAVGQTTIDMPALANIKVASIQSLIMGVKSSGYQEQDVVTFQLLDGGNLPYPPGLAVTFTHSPLGGSTIGPPPVTPCGTPGCIVTFNGVTDASGKAAVTLYSGTIAGTVNVTISATGGNQTVNLTSPTIAIVGAKANGGHITLTCTPRNIPALLEQDCVHSLTNAQTNCTITLADRFNNVLGVPTVVTYQSEAGIVGPPAATPAYDPANPNNPNLGRATDYVNTQGGNLPIDVAPWIGPQWGDEQPTGFTYATFNDGQCGTKQHNPRDGAVTIIAFTQGEEGYVDSNGNGQYDLGEPFIDLGEPFVDANDNNKWDPGEYFLDMNGNSVWDGPNGTWDANTTIWAETRVVFTGRPYYTYDAGSGTEAYSRWVTGLSATLSPTTQPYWSLNHGPPPDFTAETVQFMDENFNVLAPGTTYSISNVVGTQQAALISAMIPVHEEGFFFQQQYCTAAGPPCGPVCPPAAGVTTCVRKTNINSFEYMVSGSVKIVAGSQAEPVEASAATATINGYTLTVYGYGQTN